MGDLTFQSTNELDSLILSALKEFLQLKCINETHTLSDGKLVFPLTSNNKRRVSEQEARLLLVKHLEKIEQIQYQYSIEAPTSKNYTFTGIGARSGNIDLCIYKNGKRFSLIELKSKNPKQESYTHDFEKLFCDDGNCSLNYFLQILENTDKGTLPSIKDKYCKAIDSLKNKALLSSIRIYICDLGKKSIIIYDITKDGTLTHNGTTLCN